jgi:HEAT repeat protein
MLMVHGRLGFCLLVAAAGLLIAGACQTTIDPEEELLRQLKHGDVRERITAASLISGMRPVPEKFIVPLLEALNDNEPQVRQAAADALSEVGLAGRPHIVQIGKLSNEHFDHQVRHSLQNAFNRINAEQ